MAVWTLGLLLGLLLGVSGALQPPAVLLHLSDLHLSTNVAQYWGAFGDREGDLLLFAQRLLPLLAPLATLLTGDLTDSKDSAGAGVQQEAEWQAYRRSLDAFVAAGIPEASILDLRGNHDVFNMPQRGGANDYFSTYAAEGRRAPPAKRVFPYLLPASGSPKGVALASNSSGDRGGTAAGGEGRHRRRLAGAEAGKQVAAAADCPAAAVVGIDVSPEPGLRSPANFAGVTSEALLRELRAGLEALASAVPPGCPSPPLLAHGHYPLSTVDFPTHDPGPLGMLRHMARSVRSMQGVGQLLADYNVSAYLNGHLHAAFGQRLHRMHATPAGGHLAELETAAWKDDRRFRLLAADGGALSFADLFFHTPNSPARPKRSDRRIMHESAWIDAYQKRGYAVTSADPSARVLDHIALITWPPDARYSPLAPGNAWRPAANAVPAPAVQLGGQAGGSKPGHVASATAARGSDRAGGAAPTGRGLRGAVSSSSNASSSGQAFAQQTASAMAAKEGLVRALVFPVEDSLVAIAPKEWEVSLLSRLPNGALFAPPVSLQLSPAGTSPTPTPPNQGGLLGAGGGRLFQGTLAVDLDCSNSEDGTDGAACAAPADHLLIQVEVRGRGGPASASGRQPVGLRCIRLQLPSEDQAGRPRQQRCFVAPSEGPPLPLGTTWLEWFILAVNGPVLVHRLFLLVWACHLALLLLLPRLLGAKWALRISASPLFRPQSHPHLSSTASPSVTSLSQQRARPAEWRVAHGALAGWARAAGRSVGAFLLWPPAALVLLARERGVWTALIVYDLYLLAGPWYLAEMLTPGYPWAMMFHYGVLLRMPPGAPPLPGGHGSWRFNDTSDVMFVTLVHYLFCVVPLTLWVACVASSRQLAAGCACAGAAARPGSGSSSNGSSCERGGSGGNWVSGGNGSRGGCWAGRLRVVSVPQALALAAIVGVYGVGALDKAAKLNGTVSVLASPGFAWTIPLAVLLALWPQLPDKRAGCLGKRE